MTRSRIEAVNQTAKVLADFADNLRSGAPVLERAADVYVKQVQSPNGSEWHGETASSLAAIAHRDRLTSVVPVVDQVQELADVSERGSENLLAAQETALQAIVQAEDDDFAVSENLSVSDRYLWQSAADQEARQEAAVAYRNYIAHCAARLEQDSTLIAGQLSAGAAALTAMTPAHWRQPFTATVPAAGARAPNALPSDGSTNAKAVDRRPPSGKALNGLQPLSTGGIKEAPGAEALSVHNKDDVHHIVDPLPPGRNPGVKTIPTPEGIRRLYEQLTENGKPIPSGTYPGERSLLDDGTEIKYRATSKWGGPTVEIRYPDGTTVDVHLPDRPEKPEPSRVPAPEPSPVPVRPSAPAPEPTAPPSAVPDAPTGPSSIGGGSRSQPPMSTEQEGVLGAIVGIGAALIAGIGAMGEWAFSR